MRIVLMVYFYLSSITATYLAIVFTPYNDHISSALFSVLITEFIYSSFYFYFQKDYICSIYFWRIYFYRRLFKCYTGYSVYHLFSFWDCVCKDRLQTRRDEIYTLNASENINLALDKLWFSNINYCTFVPVQICKLFFNINKLEYCFWRLFLNPVVQYSIFLNSPFRKVSYFSKKICSHWMYSL